MTLPARTDLGGTADRGGETLISLVHLSDLHVLDAASPARAEWVELEAGDPRFQPLLHMHRPYDALTAFAVLAHVEAIRDLPEGPTGRPFDLAISTGDNIDNAQYNELAAYLALITGGTTQLSAVGSAQDATPEALALTAADGVWPYWSPDTSVPDAWRVRLGYPAVDDFIARASAPITSPGFGLPWTSVPGNHDVMRQGTSLENESIAAIAVGTQKSLRRPPGFSPADAVQSYLDAPESFSTGAGFAIAPDAGRRIIDRREWLAEHVRRGALGYHVGGPDTAPMIDTVIDTEHVRFVLFDTNHPDGDYQGSLGHEQLAWLDERLAEVDAETGRVAILVSHHGVSTLVNDRGDRDARVLGTAIDQVVGGHRSAVAWLVGHRHVHRIAARPGPAGGYWEITTGSIIDWPSQARAIDIVRRPDGSLDLVCALRDHGGHGLAGLHRDLAWRFATPPVAAHMAGGEGDGSVRLVLPPR